MVRLFRPHPRISLALSADALALADLYDRAWADCRGLISDSLAEENLASAEEVLSWLGGGFEVYVARLGGDLVGTIRCSFPAGSCLIDRLAVGAAFRNQGIGAALVDHALSRARRAGVTRAWLNVPRQLEPLAGFVRSLGFRESVTIHPPAYDTDTILMEIAV
ncbi:MAG TPA: GNAT family N-acetyltransferase [Candidatus Dormibacteraeota bacterium]|jgi:GNAT superfamily N-acetyltransferase|nr:GNAT family N-acetyltransferase [Candidatus Dormibacteraeota bacterium]